MLNATLDPAIAPLLLSPSPVEPSLIMALLSFLYQVLNPPLPGFLQWIPLFCRLAAMILATPFALFTVLDVIAYAIARTLHISLRSLRVPHSPPTTKSTLMGASVSAVPLTPSASALSLIQDSGSENEADEVAPAPSIERRRSEKSLRMTDLSGLRMRKPVRENSSQGLALSLTPSSASTISNVSGLSQFSVDSSTASTPTEVQSKTPPILGRPISLDQMPTQTAYPSPPLSPARGRIELAPDDGPSDQVLIATAT